MESFMLYSDDDQSWMKKVQMFFSFPLLHLSDFFKSSPAERTSVSMSKSSSFFDYLARPIFSFFRENPKLLPGLNTKKILQAGIYKLVNTSVSNATWSHEWNQNQSANGCSLKYFVSKSEDKCKEIKFDNTVD